MKNNHFSGFMMVLLALFLSSLACNFPVSIAKVGYTGSEYEGEDYGAEKFQKDLYDEYGAKIVPDPGDPMAANNDQVNIPDNSNQTQLNPGQSEIPNADGTLKPVGFVNYGTFDATVRPWTWIPLGSDAPDLPSSASTVSSANDGIGDWPNTSRFLSVPMGTYTWCVDWEEEDKDEDGYFDDYHYITSGPTLLDENDSDELEFAEEVAISAPPVSAPVYAGKCADHPVDFSCVGKSTEVQTSVRHINQEPVYPVDIQALADTGYRAAPEGISIAVSGSATEWYGTKILWDPGDWIEATTSDSYRAMGVQIFGDMTIGWARVLFDGQQIWEGDTSEAVINADENNGLGWYGVYVEVRCFPPGTHTLRVESSRAKEGVGGWQGGVPVNLFGFIK
jgi:hypothetical protein